MVICGFNINLHISHCNSLALMIAGRFQSAEFVTCLLPVLVIPGGPMMSLSLESSVGGIL